MQSDELKEEIKSLYEQGKTIRQIASEKGMSYSKVRRILLNSGIQFRGRLSTEIVNKVIELAKEGNSANKISKMLDINSNTILRILKKNNLASRKRKLTTEDIEKIKDMYLKGESIYRIAKDLKISTNLVVYHLKKMNIYKPKSY
ncbi:CRISPR DNA repeat-binding protein Cbp1 [Acidianus manzaensis]|uniref:CRISPR-associated protein n=1 Tax=Acidianus manzaensis TaxID=282676 RepID=A0A1W6K0S3_9CREN|nr:CRISPR DNA repeat-binding protein Cbp1 [Acidianus manzaensis]ARM76097.1 CRISPR-associated protein [Acidianus manzaensis]